jgi:hypothetical protein
MRMTGTSGAFARTRERNSIPSISGITTSERTASTASSSSFSRPRAAEVAVSAV